MPNLQRYIQQYAPSGRVGPQEVNPEALTHSGAELPWRGVEAAGGAVAGLSDTFLKVQAMEDEAALSSSERQAGEHMAKLWNDIANEPDYTKHKELYDNAFSTASQFAPKGPRAARMFTQRLNERKPSWDGQYYAATTRRKIDTIASSEQANYELSLDQAKRSIEAGNDSEAESSMLGVQRAADRLAEYGIWTPEEAKLQKEKASRDMAVSVVWSDAISIMGTDGREKAEQHVMDTGLTNDQKMHVINEIRYVDYGNQAKERQATEADREKHRQVIFSAMQSGNWEMIPNIIKTSNLSADEKYAWDQRVRARMEAVASGKKDVYNQSDPYLLWNLKRGVLDKDPRVTDEYIASFVGKVDESGKGGISVDDYFKLKAEMAKPASEKNTVNDELVKSYMSQLAGMDKDYEAWYPKESDAATAAKRVEYSVKEYLDYQKEHPDATSEELAQVQRDLTDTGEPLSVPVVKGKMIRAFQQYVDTHPNAKPEELDKAFNDLSKASSYQRIPHYMNLYHIRELQRTNTQTKEQTAFRMPMTLQTAPAPTTPEDFAQTVKDIQNEDEARAYYDRYKALWQPKPK